MKKLLVISLALVAALGLGAAEPVDTTGIIGMIDANPKLTVSQPAKLAERLLPERTAQTGAAESASVATGGYRVQVYSGNNPRTARAEAHGRSANISAEFPEWTTYVNFDAPYWRLKVGDFRSYEEARSALSLLKKHFPSYAREMRIVRDRIKSAE